jgi:hypothetical protein
LKEAAKMHTGLRKQHGLPVANTSVNTTIDFATF